MKQKVLITNNESEVSQWLSDGWVIQMVAAGFNGSFCFILRYRG